MSTYELNLSGGSAAVGEGAQFIQNVYRIGADQPPVRAVLRDELRTIFDRHTGFGGRRAELTALTDWLRWEQGGYHFVTAPSGYGKTALLVHLAKMLEEQDHTPVYHFVSQRDEPLSDADFTFRNLCQQLMAWHGFGGSLPTSTADVRVLYSALLGIPPESGRSLIVIIDALDEAQNWTAGPTMFPALPPRVHVVFSAREVADRDWLADLHLTGKANVLRLTTLDEDGVRDLLEVSGAPTIARVAQDPAFVRAVHEVSAGDPFYLHYLIPDLAKITGLNVADVRRQPPGLDAYLDRWWRDISAQLLLAPAVADVLGYLLVADGRLNRDALADIDDDDHLNGFTVDAAVAAVQRYVIGSAESGYVLCHPRFAEYVRTRRLRPNDLRRYRAALLSWCLSWHEQGWPTDTPDYPLRHLVGHLRADGSRQAHLPDVLDAPFLVAKLVRFGSFRALMDDLRVGVGAVSERVDQMIRLAVTHAAIAAAIADLRVDELASSYVRAGRLEQALDLAAAATPPWRQRLAQGAIVQALLPDAWRTALSVTQSIDDPGSRVHALAEIALALLANDATVPEAQVTMDRVDETDLDAVPAQWTVPWLARLAAALRTRDPARAAAVLRRTKAFAEAAQGQSRAMAFEQLGHALRDTDAAGAAEAYRHWLSALDDMGLNHWAATEARDALRALAECDPSDAEEAAEALTGTLIVPYVCAGMAEQTDDPAIAHLWARRALAGIPEIRSLYKSESKQWEDQVRAAAAVGLARHDTAAALQAVTDVSYSEYRDEALVRMASLSLGWQQISLIAAAASDAAAKDSVLAAAVRRMAAVDPTGAAEHVSHVHNPVTAAELRVELAESATSRGGDVNTLIAAAEDAAVEVESDRPDLVARLAGVLRGHHQEAKADHLLNRAVDEAAHAAPSPSWKDSPIMTVARCCLDQGHVELALKLLGHVGRSVAHLSDRHAVREARELLVRVAAGHDESRATALVSVSREADRPVLTAALAAGVTATDPDRAWHLVDALPGGHRGPVGDARCKALGSLLIGLAASGAASTDHAAALVRECHGSTGWLDFKCDTHARAATAVARHDAELAERLLRWAAERNLGSTPLLAEAIEALAAADLPRARIVARDVANWSSDSQEDLAILVSATARFARDDAQAEVDRGRPVQHGYLSPVLGWIAASLAAVDREGAVDLVHQATEDAMRAEWEWLRVDALREVAFAVATWWPEEAEVLLSRCLDLAREGTAVTTVAEQIAEAATVRLRLSGPSEAAELIDESLALLPREAHGATHADALTAILHVVRQFPPELLTGALARVVETALEASTLVLDELPAILETALAADPAEAGRMSESLFAALDTAEATVTTILSA